MRYSQSFVSRYYRLTRLLVLGIALSLASCELEDQEIPTEELYLREFIKEFGVFDQDHTWNLATQASITITPTGHINEAKVYARYEGKYYYVARAINASREFTLTFDVPSGVTDLKLKIDGQTYYAQSGTSITASGGGNTLYSSELGNSRTIYEGTYTDPNISFTKTEDFLYLTPEDITAYTERLPEIGYKTTYNNLGRVTQNFYFKSNGTFTVHPVFWCTSRTNTLGLYTRSKNSDGSYNINTYDFYENEPGEIEYITENNSTWTTVDDPNGSPGTISPKAILYRSRGITIEIEEGVEFGMFIRIAGGISSYIHWQLNPSTMYHGIWPTTVPDGITQTDYTYLYSEKELNPVWTYEETSSGVQLAVKEYTCYAGTFDYTASYTPEELNLINNYTTYSDASRTFRVLTFEDWHNYTDESDMDLNDMVFFITSGDPLKIPQVTDIDNPDPDPTTTEETFDWLIAAEDLGTTDDFDFNDMVVRVTSTVVKDVDNTTTTSTVKFQALAAGGTLPIYLHLDGFDNDIIDTSKSSITDAGILYPDGTSDAKAEWHQWFGDGYVSGTMINTGAGTSADGKTCTVVLNKEYKVSAYSQITSGKIEGFYFTVNGSDATSSVVDVVDPNGKAPQMFVIPDIGSNSNGWEWPHERNQINVEYPQFDNWAKNHNDATAHDWHKNPRDNAQIITNSRTPSKVSTNTTP